MCKDIYGMELNVFFFQPKAKKKQNHPTNSQVNIKPFLPSWGLFFFLQMHHNHSHLSPLCQLGPQCKRETVVQRKDRPGRASLLAERDGQSACSGRVTPRCVPAPAGRWRIVCVLLKYVSTRKRSAFGTFPTDQNQWSFCPPTSQLCSLHFHYCVKVCLLILSGWDHFDQGWQNSVK